MNYRKIYDNFIISRKEKHIEGYFEIHHIVPRSSGGSDDESNLIKLSARDHFFAHLLLSKFAGLKMKIALQYMLYGKSGNQSEFRFRPSSRRIGKIIEEANEARKALLSGRVFTEEHRSNLSKSKKGKESTFKGKCHSEESKQVMSEKLKNKEPWNKNLTGQTFLNQYVNGKPKPPSMLGMKWINDGVNQRKIKSTDELPEGWSYGRIDMKGNKNPMRKNKDVI